MRRLGSLLMMFVCVAACHSPSPSTPTTKKASPRPLAEASPQPTRLPSTPASKPSGDKNAVPDWDSAPQLQKPAEGGSLLTGVFTLDPSYIVSAGAGNIVAAGAGNIIAAGAGNIIAAGAGNLQVGGRIVSAGAGNIVAAGAGNLNAQSGNGIVAAGAGNIVSTDSGNIIAAGAGNIVAAGAGNLSGPQTRHLLEQRASGDPIPGAGMMVSAISLRTHKYLQLGTYKDAAGKTQPAYAIYTNAEGRYQMYLPPEEDGNVLVVACPPGVTADDRLVYNVVAPASAKEVHIDEDVALAHRYLHLALAGRLEEILEGGRPHVDYVMQLFSMVDGICPALPLFRNFLEKLADEADRRGVPKWSRGDIKRLSLRITEVGLAQLPAQVPLNNQVYGKYHGDQVDAVRYMADSLGVLRKACQEKLQKDAKSLTQPYVFLDPCGNPLAPEIIEVKKSTDLGDYVVTNFLTINMLNAITNVGKLYDNVLQTRPPQPQMSYDERIEASTYAMLQALFPLLIANWDASSTTSTDCSKPECGGGSIKGAMQQYVDEYNPSPVPDKTPVPILTCGKSDGKPTPTPRCP